MPAIGEAQVLQRGVGPLDAVPATARLDEDEEPSFQNLADCTWEMARYTRHKALTMERGFNDDADFPP